ncbi:hypothetical protein EVAR_88049_1 [Eumeta japonica]|uniref:Uncharacterized protein n=1 Tax=Eumeta variegata TaxID=151549 RepID=A0A4C1VCX6_EUMVA|nr:hypothetical protein EVAR_88049_1 [Eumeta japonica]
MLSLRLSDNGHQQPSTAPDQRNLTSRVEDAGNTQRAEEQDRSDDYGDKGPDEMFMATDDDWGQSLDRFGLYVSTLLRMLPKRTALKFQVQIIDRLYGSLYSVLVSAPNCRFYRGHGRRDSWLEFLPYHCNRIVACPDWITAT